ncbi:MAG: DUF6328 family protein [Gaiellaceae bacterium]
MAESEKDRTDRQLIELLNELRVVLPGAQILLAFLLTVPFATRFGRVSRGDKIALFVGLMATVSGTVLLLAPSVYHRLRWGRGGKQDVIRVGNRFFLVGTALLAIGIVAVLYLVGDVLFGTAAAIAGAAAVGALVASTWYLLPLQRMRRPDVEHEE